MKKKDKDKQRKKMPPSRQSLYKLYMRTRLLATCSPESINHTMPVLPKSDIVLLTHDDSGVPCSLEQTATVYMALHTPQTSKLTTFDEFVVELATLIAFTPPAVVAAVEEAVARISAENSFKPAEVAATETEAETEEDSEEDSEEDELEDEESLEDPDEESEETDETEDEEEPEEEEVAAPPPKLEIPAEAVRKKKKKKKKNKNR